MRKTVTLLLIYASVISCFIICFSGTKGNWSGLNLTTYEINATINFQLSRGSTCIAEFENLSTTLNKFIENKCDLDRLNEVLGEPNIKEKTTYIYYLTANANGCKAILETKNNTLISYSLENLK